MAFGIVAQVSIAPVLCAALSLKVAPSASGAALNDPFGRTGDGTWKVAF